METTETIRQKSLDWFYSKSEKEKELLKDKYFANEHIQHSTQWGYHFTFGNIEKMYLEETNNVKE
jgi:hypothetical protein